MNVEEIRALCDAATGGPWEIYRYRTGGGRIHLSGDDGRRRTLIADMEGTEGDIATVYNEGDREFLFAARTLVPELADRVEQAERVAAELREENAFLRAENDARCGRDDYDPAPIITMYDGKVAECEALQQRIAAVEALHRPFTPPWEGFEDVVACSCTPHRSLDRFDAFDYRVWPCSTAAALADEVTR